MSAKQEKSNTLNLSSTLPSKNNRKDTRSPSFRTRILTRKQIPSTKRLMTTPKFHRNVSSRARCSNLSKRSCEKWCSTDNRRRMANIQTILMSCTRTRWLRVWLPIFSRRAARAFQTFLFLTRTQTDFLRQHRCFFSLIKSWARRQASLR